MSREGWNGGAPFDRRRALRIALTIGVVVVVVLAGVLAWNRWWRPIPVDAGGGVSECGRSDTGGAYYGGYFENESDQALVLTSSTAIAHGVDLRVGMFSEPTTIGYVYATDARARAFWATRAHADGFVVPPHSRAWPVYLLTDADGSGGWVDHVGFRFRTASGASRSVEGHLRFGLSGTEYAHCGESGR